VQQFEDVDETGKARQKEVGEATATSHLGPVDSSFPESRRDSPAVPEYY